METWVEEIEGWDARSYTGGYAGLRDLADREFSGAVSAGEAWLFMVNGRVVGVVRYRAATGQAVADADIDRFEDAEGTAYAAPDPAVPLLVAMKTADGETRAKYYTEDTPVAEVHDALADGGFTGYLELSENVLSGDYYLVYQGGRASRLAFVGNARRLFTGDDAYERITDEVGIYEVVAVDLDVVEIPEPETDTPEHGSTGSPSDARADAVEPGSTNTGSGTRGDADEQTAAVAAPGDTATDDRGDDVAASADAAGAEGATDDESTGSTTHEPTESGTDPDDDPTAGEQSAEAEPEQEAEPGVDRESVADAGTTPNEPADANTPSADVGTTDTAAGPSRADASTDTAPGGSRDAGDDDVGRSRERDRQTDEGRSPTAEGGSHSESSAGHSTSTSTDSLVNRSIPSLDPDKTGVADDGGDGRDRAATGPRTREQVGSPDGREGGRPNRADRGRARERDRELEAARAKLEELREERDALREERADLREQVERLQERVADLEAELEEARAAAAEAGAATGDGPSLSAAEAFAGTNLFVRYDSKGALTLADVHDGEGDPGDLASNLVLEHHTQFEDEGATVAGQPFEEWLLGTQRYRFVQWLFGDLLFEIRDTGAADAMRDLYDALPEVDRVELDAAVEIETREGTEERSFGLVARDRMGQPLLVADLDSSREPVSEVAMASLIEAGQDVCRSEEPFAGAFFVASSFFDPDALETAREATSGSLLSRDKRKSFVKLSRKRGFHLGLVEARDGSFHLSVPDL